MITPDKVRVYVACKSRDGKKEKLRLWHNGSYLTPVDGDIWVVPSRDHIYHCTRIEADLFTHTVSDVRIVDADGIKRWDMKMPKYCRNWLPLVMPNDNMTMAGGINTRGILTDVLRQRAKNFLVTHGKTPQDGHDYTDDELREALRTMREIYN